MATCTFILGFRLTTACAELNLLKKESCVLEAAHAHFMRVVLGYYNNRRPHTSIGMTTPAEASKTSGDRDMKWTSHRLLAIKFRNMTDITEKALPLQPDRDKTQMVNSSRINGKKSIYISINQ